jgi:exopolyphosphatase/guanosine-5'-triphosphate,3'-diphosphate pyrophosphatase
MIKRFGVIDLGSNTFHLLIVDQTEGSRFKAVFRKRIFTSLSEGGIDFIKTERIEAGLNALKEFKKYITQYHCTHTRVIGTAVLRTASNSMDFIGKAEDILGINIEIIDGSREAEYIFQGITLSPEVNTGTHLVMDIGGGSTEFILIKAGKILFSKSYNIGVGALHAMFHKSEPISATETEEMMAYILNKTADLQAIIKEYHPEYLTGASGSFEVLELMTDRSIDGATVSLIDPEAFLQLYSKVVSADESERQKMKGLPKERVKLIVVGMILKRVIFDLVHPKGIYVSPFALKEGIIREMITNAPNMIMIK